MLTRASKSEDMNETAFRVIQHSTRTAPKLDRDAVSAAAAALGRLGASKGGKAKAKSLSRSRRKAIAKKAAAARWGK
jgi:hypothetical protein